MTTTRQFSWPNKIAKAIATVNLVILVAEIAKDVATVNLVILAAEQNRESFRYGELVVDLQDLKYSVYPGGSV